MRRGYSTPSAAKAFNISAKSRFIPWLPAGEVELSRPARTAPALRWLCRGVVSCGPAAIILDGPKTSRGA
jgi:hypothetical protein